MEKRARSFSTSPSSGVKKTRTTGPSSTFNPNKIATHQAAAAVDANPPLSILLKTVEDGLKNPAKGKSIVYWMRMGDLRIHDNRALSLASAQAQKDNIPLIVLFILSPQDYKSLADLHIPLHILTEKVRQLVPAKLVSLLSSLECTTIYANMEYEVDEIRRDVKVCSLAKQDGIDVTFVHDKCIVDPGVIVSGENKPYVVYSAYQRRWLVKLNDNLPYYLEDCAPPKPNSESIRNSEYSNLFDSPMPIFVEGFQLDEPTKKKMALVWPAGEEKALLMLERFLHTKARTSQMGFVDPLASGAEESKPSSRIVKYDTRRDVVDSDTTSRLSPYLSAGVISARTCVRASMKLLGVKKVDGGKTTGVGRWVQELAWRDFYINLVVAFPRVSMGRPWLEKYAAVVWEAHQSPEKGEHSKDSDSELLKAWKNGMTGYPIVDATMRCIREMGWVHNRLRMITAMFLTKNLMFDWRVGERYFMESLIDGDLASNNGGWQWCASTGVDPCPYFRIFNPYNQSVKADPKGEFIRHFVPELASIKTSEIHNPSPKTARALGYPLPIVDYKETRERALRRFKTPGEM
ncbi:DNA photolyase, FAD-binding/Cryptochrome [Desarmillaria tabescens]|uniref:DNA photolyase, FAD-binding/Cryptochrome n=1 Tax=Armillaria tabescens TaxID=1929756 RepID=A0AA39NM48_ARMTA|nr:DNA photolyase, FAD-binding/Cryptochrome [Desarmillaria tabescens]KAK0468156.1 DNA photolyase, FAD-binding/Cryptochrome [Desarmillaria tabescens]